MGVQFAGNILVQSNGGPLPISQGGTGQTTSTGAINALLPLQTGQSGKYLTTNGTNVSWVASSGGTPGGADTQVQYNDSGTFGGGSFLTINKSTGALTSTSFMKSTNHYLSDIAGSFRTLDFQTAGSDRWLLQANNTSESGSNTGSDFEFVRVADNGLTQNKVYTVARSTGVVDFKSTPTVNGVAIGTGSGTVTSVAVSGGTTGLTTSGGPITSSGTITLAGTLALANGGTGATSQAGAANAVLPTQTGQTGKYLTTDGSNVSWATVSASGSVTSVGVSSNGTYAGAITVGASPVTSSGTITLTPNVFSASTPGVVPTSPGGTTAYLRADGTWQTPSTGTATSLAATSLTTVTGASVPTLFAGPSFGGANNYPGVFMAVPGAAANNRISGIYAENNGNGTIRFNLQTDAGSNTGGDYMVVTRSGQTPTVTITGSTITLNGPVTGTSFSGTGTSLTALNASNLSSGTVGTARLGTGTANSTTFLRGDGTWAAPSVGAASAISGGAAGQMLYQSAANTTGFTNAGNTGALMISNGTSAPAFNNAILFTGSTVNNSGAPLLVLGSSSNSQGATIQQNDDPANGFLIRAGDTVGGTGAGATLTVRAGNGSATNGNGGNLLLQGGNSTVGSKGFVSITTAGTERLNIGASGQWSVQGATGTAGQMLTSAGNAATPTWGASGLAYFSGYLANQSSVSGAVAGGYYGPVTATNLGSKGIQAPTTVNSGGSSGVSIGSSSSDSSAQVQMYDAGATTTNRGLRLINWQQNFRISLMDDDCVSNAVDFLQATRSGKVTTTLLLTAQQFNVTASTSSTITTPTLTASAAFVANTSVTSPLHTSTSTMTLTAGANMVIQTTGANGIAMSTPGGATVGAFTLTTGTATGGGGGNITVTAGNGTTAGGAINITSGNTTAGNTSAGAINITVGSSSGTTNGSAVTIKGGNSGSTGTGGDVVLQPGTGAGGPDAGAVLLGVGSRATAATGGFPYMPTTSGAPSGTPTAKSGFVPFVFDTSTNKLWIYNGGWKSVVLA